MCCHPDSIALFLWAGHFWSGRWLPFLHLVLLEVHSHLKGSSYLPPLLCACSGLVTESQKIFEAIHWFPSPGNLLWSGMIWIHLQLFLNWTISNWTFSLKWWHLFRMDVIWINWIKSNLNPMALSRKQVGFLTGLPVVQTCLPLKAISMLSKKMEESGLLRRLSAVDPT